MKAFGMKSLSLAVLGLVGFGMASSASATCPYPFNTPTGAWSAQLNPQGTLAAGSPGLELVNPSACKMNAFLNPGATSLATAAVVDLSPTNELSYHFRFYVDTTQLGNLGATPLTSVQLFAANDTAVFPASGNAATNAMLRIGLARSGGANPNLVMVASCNVPANSYFCVGSTPLTPGVHWIEGHLTTGGSAIANLWVDQASITSDASPAPAIALSFDNSPWTGVDTVALGLGGASPPFRANFNGAAHTVGFDSFDSRRQTFIGQ